MRIAYTTEYECRIDGVFNRVRNESEWMKAQGHEIRVFSTNSYKPWLRLSENVSFWAGKKFRRDMWNFAPDIIVCNTYRHPETDACAKIAKAMGIPCVLVTHAPFDRDRGILFNLFAWIYDKTHNINKFDAIFRIADWEMPYLEKLNCMSCDYVPNAIPDRFFEEPITNGEGVFYFGRNHQIKDIPTLQKACELLGINPAIIDNIPAHDIQGKIDMFKRYNIFVLPSKKEGVPQALLEAMSMGKICIASKTQGAIEIIKNKENGYLFDIGNHIELANIIGDNDGYDYKIRVNARKTAEQFKASKIYAETERRYMSLISSKSKPKSI